MYNCYFSILKSVLSNCPPCKRCQKSVQDRCLHFGWFCPFKEALDFVFSKNSPVLMSLEIFHPCVPLPYCCVGSSCHGWLSEVNYSWRCHRCIQTKVIEINRGIKPLVIFQVTQRCCSRNHCVEYGRLSCFKRSVAWVTYEALDWIGWLSPIHWACVLSLKCINCFRKTQSQRTKCSLTASPHIFAFVCHTRNGDMLIIWGNCWEEY